MLRRGTRKIVNAGVAVGILAIAAVVVVLSARGVEINGLYGDYEGGTSYAVPREVGQSAVFTTMLVNRSGKPVTIESATQYGTAGYPMPRIRRLRIKRPPGLDGNPGGVDHEVSLNPGYVLPSGRAAVIHYDAYAERPGNYVSVGLKLVLRQGSTEVTVKSVGGAQVVCASSHSVPDRTAACDHVTSRVSKIVNGV